jgi:hypothetical protein
MPCLDLLVGLRDAYFEAMELYVRDIVGPQLCPLTSAKELDL